MPKQSEERVPETRWTPGPWLVESGGFVGGPVGFGTVCQFWNKFEEDFTNCEANAHLIAAAPDLYEALVFVKEFFNRLENGTPDDDMLREMRRKYHAPVHAKIDAALARARGESR